jgi:hypothetical protein
MRIFPSSNMKMATEFRRGQSHRGMSRRGVTLLMVVSIIVLFLLMGAAFLVLATQFRRSATALSHVRERRDDAQTLVKRAFKDLLREPSLENARSPLRGHSLLGDLYGYGFKSKELIQASALRNMNDGSWTLTLEEPNHWLISDLDGIDYSPFSDDGSYNGRLLTLTNFYNSSRVSLGENLALTGEILDFEVIPPEPPTGRQYRWFLRFGWDDAQLLLPNLKFNFFHIHINGRPFVGSGAGLYTPPTGSITNFREPALSGDALKPNRTGESRSQLLNKYLGIVGGNSNFRSTNEDYDAVDYQNMFLGAVRFKNGSPRITPSFYRPELVRYWQQSGAYNDPINQHSLGRIPYSFHADRVNNGNPIYIDANSDGIPDLNRDPSISADPFDVLKDVTWDVDNDGDGVNDSIWMDIDLPIQTDVKGKVYKPLVAYHVLDMDSRLNLNFHGNQYQRDPTNPSKTADALQRKITLPDNSPALHGLYGDGALNDPLDGVLHPTGVGIGTGEISLGYTFSQQIIGRLLFGFDGDVGRYGSDGSKPPSPGVTGVNNAPGAFGGLIDAKSRIRFQNYPVGTFVGNTGNFGLVNDQLFRSPLDIHGRFELGVPNVTVSVLQDPYDSASSPVNIAHGMPIVNAIGSNLPNELVDSVYEMDASQAPFTPRLGFNPNLIATAPNERGIDSNYSPHELESILRAFDFDSRQLPSRLRKFLPDLFTGASSQLRHLLTTDSWELPVAPQPLNELFRNRFKREPSLTDLPEEVFHGKKLSLNRLVNPQHLFNLIILVCPERIDYDYNADGSVNPGDKLSFRKDIAQWCVNVKDFMDPDSANTPFSVNLLPLPAPDDNGPEFVKLWGCERPELLLTESFALHDKRLQDLDTEPNGGTLNELDPNKKDTDLDSRFVPNASAFFELYNPWFYANNENTRGNSGRPPVDVYDANRDGVHLQKVVGDSPVWRLRVLNSSTNTNGDIDEQNIGDDSADVVKIVYFARPGNSFLNSRHGSNPDVVFFPPASLGTVPSIEPGKRAIICSAGVARNDLYTTYIGRLNAGAGPWNAPGALARTRKIVLDPKNFQVRTLYWDNASASMREQIARKVVCIPIGEQFIAGAGGSKPRNFGLTDPKRGYDVEAAAVNPAFTLNPVADGFEFFDSATMLPVTLDVPADRQFQDTRWQAVLAANPTGGGLKDKRKILSCFTAHLQRLADPTRPFNATDNPYLTVDYIGSDVSVINGIYAGTDPDESPVPAPADDLASFERGEFHNRLGTLELFGGPRTRLLWKGTQDGSLPSDAIAPRNNLGADSHISSLDVIQSFGELDLAYRSESNHAFPWLTWNNRPYTSQFELQNVPYTPQGLLLSRFDIAPSSNLFNPYEGKSGRADFGKSPPPPNDPNSLFPHAADRFNHLFNFYADSVTSGLPAAIQGPPALHRLFDYIHVESQFAGATDRLPGKINLNTISDERVWLGLMQRYGEPNSLQNPYGTVTWQQFDQSRRGNNANLPTEIPFLFRNADAVHRVPLPELLKRTSSANLFRSSDFVGIGTAPSLPPLFELKTSPGDWANPDRNAYFRYDIRQRLGNLVTTRSNVYAVWVTVGFFEIDPATGKPVNEIGQEEGTVQRHRGFFLVDRSIPVAFEPGRDHDVQNCVLVESIIQREVTSQK